MKILCTICARGGSKGLTNKALRKINDKPLIYYTIKQAIKSKVFDQVVVSTDSKKIQKVAKYYGAKSWFLRPKKFSHDASSKLVAVRHALVESEKYFKKYYEICVDLDITSPLRNINDIKNALRKFKQEKASNLISVCEAKKNPYFNMIEKKENKIKIVKYKKNSNKFSRSYSTDFSISRRQDAPKVYEMNASIYIYNRKNLIKKIKLLNNRTSIFLMPRNRSVDIDDIYDFNLVKLLLKN
tara:strand:+ start:97 stop:819 length:723 start_codon:yes stop_codon:yes gene_type:complete